MKVKERSDFYILKLRGFSARVAGRTRLRFENVHFVKQWKLLNGICTAKCINYMKHCILVYIGAVFVYTSQTLNNLTEKRNYRLAYFHCTLMCPIYYFILSTPDDFTCQGESAATQWVKDGKMHQLQLRTKSADNLICSFAYFLFRSVNSLHDKFEGLSILMLH
jgi:hypothetical protein